jgi:mono/diheme cytochrome c family protein
MPAWGEILTDQEVNDVVCYERVVLSGQDPVPVNCTTEGAAAGEATGGH